jgi:hypothetical protein
MYGTFALMIGKHQQFVADGCNLITFLVLEYIHIEHVVISAVAPTL